MKPWKKEKRVSKSEMLVIRECCDIRIQKRSSTQVNDTKMGMYTRAKNEAWKIML